MNQSTESQQLDTEEKNNTNRVLPWTHNSFETAFLIEDYPYGRTLRCQKKVWIEKATKGSQKGKMRVCYRTTNPKYEKEVWNKQHNGEYSQLLFLYIEKDTGYIKDTGIGSLGDLEYIEKWKAEWYNLLDEEQKNAVDMTHKASVVLNDLWNRRSASPR